MKPEIESGQVPRATDRELPASLPLAELVEHLSLDLKTLVHEETALAKHELSDGFESAKREAAVLAAGAGALAAGALVLLAAGVLALATVLPAWSAALVVGIAVSLIGALLVLSGRAKLQQVKLKPTRALENVQKDLSSIKRAAT